MFSRTRGTTAPKSKRAVASAFALMFASAFVLVSIVDPTADSYAETTTLTSENQPGQDVENLNDEGSAAGFSAYVIETPTPTPTPTPVAVPAAGSSSGSGTPAIVVPQAAAPNPGSAQAIAYGMLASYGWGDDQFGCLVSLWERESNWNVYAHNVSSGAYGIPQALPGSKMSTAGADWQTNPATQIAWGLGYISGRYGTPCGAWGHSEAVGWY